MGTAIVTLISLMAVSAGPQPPHPNGVWVGTEVEHKSNRVTLIIRDTAVVFTDHTDLVVAQWTPPNSKAFDGREVVGTSPLKIDFTRRLAQNKRTLRSKSPAWGAVKYSQHRMLFCVGPKDARRSRAFVPTKAPDGRPVVRCFAMSRVPNTAIAPNPESCVQQCVRANQMRAVAPDVIVNDCRQSCGVVPQRLPRRR